MLLWMPRSKEGGLMGYCFAPSRGLRKITRDETSRTALMPHLIGITVFVECLYRDYLLDGHIEDGRRESWRLGGIGAI